VIPDRRAAHSARTDHDRAALVHCAKDAVGRTARRLWSDACTAAPTSLAQGGITMHVREVLAGMSLIVVLYASTPLLMAGNAFDACCSPTGECPDGLTCLRDSTCGPNSQGYCVPIEVGGGK
jgi:hypothetical protein